MSGSDTNNTGKITNADLESMTDDEIMALHPDQLASEPDSQSAEYTHGGDNGDEPAQELDDENDSDDQAGDNSEEQDSDDDSSDEELDSDENESDTDGSDDSDGDDDAGSDSVGSNKDQSTGSDTDTSGSSDNVSKAGSGGDGSESGSAGSDQKAKEQEPVDSEASWKAVTEPFKANGRMMQVKTAEEARTLMQMGANYNKKMQGLAPHLKTVRSLEKAGITSEEDINYLIDLHKKDPQAINKLVGDSGIEPLDINKEEGKKYVPNQHSVSDQEVRIKEVMDSIKDSDTYQRTIKTLGVDWDETSRNEIGNNPEMIAVINDHIADGVFDMIDTELSRQRALGKLVGLSDFEAYKQVGDQIEAVGGFNELPAIKAKRATMQKPAAAVEVTPKQNVEDPKRNQKRKAAGGSRKTTSKSKENFNPLNMTDEEFEAQFGT